MRKSKKYNIVPWGFAASQDVRDAIVRAHVPRMEEGTDPRYKDEYAYTSTSSYTTGAADKHKLVEALKAQGVKILKVESAGEAFGQGGGNFSVITLGQLEDYYMTTLSVSDFGRVVSRDTGWFQQDHSYEDIDDELGLESKKRLLICQKTATEIGFSWPDDELLRATVPGLIVRDCGRIGPQTVCDLLYHWQS